MAVSTIAANPGFYAGKRHDEHTYTGGFCPVIAWHFDDNNELYSATVISSDGPIVIQSSDFGVVWDIKWKGGH